METGGEETQESDSEGHCQIQAGEGNIEGENYIDIEKEPDMDEECEVKGEVDLEKKSDATEEEESESKGANKIKKGVIKDNSDRGEDSEDDISAGGNRNNLEVGETVSDALESQVEVQVEESVVDDNVTDVVTPALKLLIFNILMPCVDIYFDSSLILRLYPQFWGCILVIVSGLLIHFIFTCFAWWQAVTKCGGSSKAQKSKTKNSGPTISRVLRQK